MRELDFIANLQKMRFLPRKELFKGIGDDAAVIERKGFFELVTTDMFVEGDHFTLDWFSPRQIAAKCVEACVSDIYAMGGEAKYLFLSLCLSPQISDKFLEEFYQEIGKKCLKHQVVLAGGDTTHGAIFVVDAVAIGEVRRKNLCLRAGAKTGDLIGVTNSLGASAAGLKLFREAKKENMPIVEFLHKNFPKKKIMPIIERYLEPKACFSESKILRKYVSSLIDVSDGIGSEIRHICRESGNGAIIDSALIPLFPKIDFVGRNYNVDPLLFAISGGEDFELLFTISEKKLFKLQKEFQNFSIIGKITRGKGIFLLKDGKRMEMPYGFDHFNF